MAFKVNNHWGVVAIASVVFDIDVGQTMEMVYPESVALSAEAKQSIAYLALPHSNKHVEGDTQFSFRCRRQDASSDAASSSSASAKPPLLPSSSFYYGFVLFRQRKDTSRSRGYFQKSLVVITHLPFVGLYDRVLRIVGPLFFQVGNPLLQALYENIGQWPAPVADSTMALQVAGTFVTFVVPKIITHEDAALFTRRWSIQDESFEVEAVDVIEEATAADDDDDGSRTIVRNGKFCMVHGSNPTTSQDVVPLTFADLLNANELGIVGLFSTFEGVEVCLWDLWQLAITGESVLIASPNARVCSQAVLAFTRTTRLVVPDNAILRQLVEAASDQGDTSPGEEFPHVSINNALLRKHFKHVTELFLKPFEEYFGMWSNHLNVATTPYMDIASFMKPFHAKEFLTALGKRSLKLPFALRTTKPKVKVLYARFIASPHFQPWFNYRRNECICAFEAVLYTLRETITAKELMRGPCGAPMTRPALVTLLAQIHKKIIVETAKSPVDETHVDTLHRHVHDVQHAIDLLSTTTTSM
ncbi:hypothetical protein DYB25_009310 [Aphanomyces astaci]|uniref:UDENN domain-containing protein n=3 Tax=Aphanomyces astaci TaxID=112090 RepID=A0A397BBE6_APHAT|nr:hypothetical protein DYB25_009310 [Aphanomyces astaci]RHY59887.1 hypothetical protein DYB34_008570 [Aphanomyces astaci]RHY76727.1 hypothetical protein DYB38_002358 [Aphanomyces astaci]